MHYNFLYPRFTLSVVLSLKCWSIKSTISFQTIRYDSFGSIIQTDDGEKYTHVRQQKKCERVWKSSVHTGGMVEKGNQSKQYTKSKCQHACLRPISLCKCASFECFFRRGFSYFQTRIKQFCLFFVCAAASKGKCWAIKCGTKEAKICVKWWIRESEWANEAERARELSINMVNNLWKTRNKRYDVWCIQRQTIFLLGKSFSSSIFPPLPPLEDISVHVRRVSHWMSVNVNGLCIQFKPYLRRIPSENESK